MANEQQVSLPILAETTHDRLTREIHQDLIHYFNLFTDRSLAGAVPEEESANEESMVQGTMVYANYLRETGNYFGWAHFSAVAMRRLRYKEIWQGTLTPDTFIGRAEADAWTDMEYYAEADQLWGTREKLVWRDHWLATRSHARANEMGVQYQGLVMTEGWGTNVEYRPTVFPLTSALLPVYEADRTFEWLDDAKAWCEKTITDKVRGGADG